MICRVGLAAVLALLAIPAVARGGQDQTVTPPPGPKSPPPDFFFGAPKASISLRGSVTFARAGGDWYDFVTDQLTVDRSDFRSGGIAGEVGVVLNPRLDLVLGGDFSATTANSEFRHYVDNNRLPINQETSLRQASVTAGVRLWLTSRGREISALAWIPSKVVPYVGGGGGGLWYEVRQEGDFVDFRTFNVFPALLLSTGWTGAGFVNGGADVHATSHLYYSFDARYLWAGAKLNEPWRSFDGIDLTGLRVSGGINVLF